MPDNPINVLVVDDNPADADLIEIYLTSKKNSDFSVVKEETLASGIKRLLSDHSIDVVLLDLSLPDSFGLKTFLGMQLTFPDMPIIVLSGLNDESVALKAVQEGAQDYLVKDEVNADIISRTLHYAIERKSAEKALKIQKMELEILNKIISSGNTAASLDELVYNVLITALDLMGFDMGSISLVDSEQRIAKVRSSLGFPDSASEIEPEVVSIDVPPYDELYIHGKTLIMENLDQTHSDISRGGILAIMRLPLIQKNNIIGAISIASKKRSSFVEHEKRILLAVRKEVANSLSKMLAEERLKEYAEEIRKDLARKQEGILKAQMLQQNLNTKVMPNIKDLNVGAFFMPSEELGGDFFDIRKAGERLLVIIADCVGHGLEASMDATLLKLISDRHVGYLAVDLPNQFLENVNKDVLKYFHRQNYPTMFACSINISTKEVFYSNSNGPMPYIINREGAKRLPKIPGFFLGYEKNAQFGRGSLKLGENEILFLYSDALVEIFGENESMVKREKIESIIGGFGKGLHKNIDYFLNEVEKLTSLPLEDDTTFLLIQSVEPHIREYNACRDEECAAISYEIQESLKSYDYRDEDIEKVCVVFEEMFLNAVSHGNKNRDDKKVRIAYKIDCEKVSIRVTDEGDGFDPSLIPIPTDAVTLENYLREDYSDKYTHGRGLWIINRYSDKVSYNEKGNEVTIEKSRVPVKTVFKYFDEQYAQMIVERGEEDDF